MADCVDYLLFALQCTIPDKHARSSHRRAYGRKFRQKRSQLQATTILLLLTMYSHDAIRNPRQLWAFPRSSNWWENIVLNNFGPHDWMQNFRMSRESFYYLCNQLKNLLEKQTTRLRKPLSVEQRVAITLWVLATPVEYRTVAHLFGIARCTVCVVVHETCEAIISKLLPVYISFPTGEQLDEVVKGFKEKWGFPQCAGAIDGSHISVTPPSMNHTDYYNRKGFYSMIVQAVVDHNYLFRNICVGWPGSVHDARVFANSLLYRKVTNGQLLQGSTLRFGSHEIPTLLVGDSAYPIQSWLMKPFAHSPTLTHEQKQFNYRLCRARVVVEIAFGRLKARWRRLSKQMDIHIDNVPYIITACCVLHNICEVHGDTFNEEWLQDDLSTDTDDTHATTTTTSSSHEGVAIRDTLVQYFSSS